MGMVKSLKLVKPPPTGPEPIERVVPLDGQAHEFEHLGDFIQHLRTGAATAPAVQRAEPPRQHLPTLLPPVQHAQAVPSRWNDEEGRVELHTAALSNDSIRMRRLLADTDLMSRISVDVLNEAGETPALCAAREGCAVSCAALLDAHADPLARDCHVNFFGDGVWPNESRMDVHGDGVSPKDGAIRGRTVIYHLRLQKCLEEVMLKAFPLTRVALVRAASTAISSFHETPALIVAAKSGYPELMAMLLTHSESLPQVHSATGMSSSGWSASGGAFGTSGSSMALGPGERGEALLAACCKRRWRCAEVLLTAGVPRAGIDGAKDKSGRTPLHLAVIAGEERLVRLLLEAGATHTLYSGVGRQPLHDACAGGHAKIAATLFEAGADPVAQTQRPWGGGGGPLPPSEDEDKTPIELAASRGHHHVCQLLLGGRGGLQSPGSSPVPSRGGDGGMGALDMGSRV